MKETVAVASWAVLLLSDLGQSHLLLGKSHVQKNGANGCVSELVVWRGCWEGGSVEEMEGGGKGQKAAGRRSVLWSNRKRTEQQKKMEKGKKLLKDKKSKPSEQKELESGIESKEEKTYITEIH